MFATLQCKKSLSFYLITGVLVISTGVSAAESAETKVAAEAKTPVVTGENDALGKPNTDDESPMMLYLVPWNANPAANNKSGKKFTLYQPWGSHFDPLTPTQTAQLNTL
jgi:hypothetical protein